MFFRGSGGFGSIEPKRVVRLSQMAMGEKPCCTHPILTLKQIPNCWGPLVAWFFPKTMPASVRFGPTAFGMTMYLLTSFS